VKRRGLSSGDELQFVVFRVGHQELGLGILELERILRYLPPTPDARGPGFLAGTIRFEGAEVPLLDLRSRAGVEPTVREETRIMVLAVPGLPLALVVDQVREVIRVDSRQIAQAGGAPPGVPAGAVGGVITRAGRNIVVIHAARLLDAAESAALREALP
jgi:purine-binding chemotaxis protein CheW